LSGFPWRVLEVSALPDYRLSIRFADGTRGEVDMMRLVHSEQAGVFASLRDTRVFESVHVDHGAVAWPNDVDLAPDALYASIAANGRCELG
jgi:hypothetical protein